jgi:triosephosphate isomerase (TIM)
MSTPPRGAIIAGNWKMHYGPRQASHFAHEIVPELGQLVEQAPRVVAVLCPPAISLASVQAVTQGFPRIELGAQNMYFEEKGAFTGELAPSMLEELCRYVILGHSERRAYFGESDDIVNKKAQAALQHGLRPIVCIGERLEQYEAGQTEDVIRFQVQRSLAHFPAEDMTGVIVAYEPIWAIGSGRAATAAGAGKVTALIRRLLEDSYGRDAATALSILYGGSATSANIGEFMTQPDIDGALVGGASLTHDFVKIVQKVIEVRHSYSKTHVPE